MLQFNVIIIKHTDQNYNECYDRCVELGYNNKSVTGIRTIDQEGKVPPGTHGKYKNYRNSDHRTDPHFLNFYDHFKAWKIGAELDKPSLVIEDYRWQQWPIPGNINDLYTEVINLSAGDWEYENTILTLPKPNYNIGNDDYPIFAKNSLKDFDAYLIKPQCCKKALDIVVKYGYMIPRVMFNTVLFDVKYFKRKLFV